MRVLTTKKLPKKVPKKKAKKVEHKGGAITAPKQQEMAIAPVDLEPARPPIDNFVMEGPRVPRGLHGTPPILLEAGLPFFMLQTPSYSDDFLLTDLKRLVKPGGMKNHHPEIRRAVFDTFEKHPSLLQHYLRT